MSKVVYNKPALSLSDQIKLLRQRKLNFVSDSELLLTLERKGYYRISGYSFPYQNKNNNSEFIQKRAWKNIISDYEFDCRLRSLVFDAIGKIEISLRAQLVYQMSITYNPNWYSDQALFRNSFQFGNDHTEILKYWNRSGDTFVHHYKVTYDQSKEPPAWMIFETATFGSVSRYYENIKLKNPGKKLFCDFWHITNRQDYDVFAGWLKNINTIRNVCAHHGRLFNKVFPFQVAKLSFPAGYNFLMNWNANCSNKIYTSLCIIKNMIGICAPNFKFEKKLKKLLKKTTKSQRRGMGFPVDWMKITK